MTIRLVCFFLLTFLSASTHQMMKGHARMLGGALLN